MNDFALVAQGAVREAAARQLRPYQMDAIERVRAAIRGGAKNVMLVAPTGSGKTVIGTNMLKEMERKGKRGAFVVDRISLIEQTSSTFDDEGLDHGVVQSSHWRYRPGAAIQLCSQQTLARRGWPAVDVVFVDEAHTVTETVRERISRRDVVTVGLTATPFTRGLGKLYDALVNVTTTNKLIADGFLAPYRIFAAVEPDMAGVRVVAGEFEGAETSKRALAVVGDVVAEYVKHGEGRKFICSAVDTAHVEELARQFLAAGINVATYTYKDRDEDRADTLIEYRKPNSAIRGLITVSAASKGFDCQDIGCVIMARPLRSSLAEHIQLFGRGLRIAPGKRDCLVLDHSGNCQRFWDECNDFFETGALELDDGAKRAKPKKPADAEDSLRKCPQCKHLHAPRPFCPNCGHEYPPKPAIEHKAGTLQELIASGDRKRLTADVWPQVCGYALAHREDPEAARRMALAIYNGMTGDWPTKRWENTTPVECGPDVARRIKAHNIRRARGRNMSSTPGVRLMSAAGVLEDQLAHEQEVAKHAPA